MSERLFDLYEQWASGERWRFRFIWAPVITIIGLFNIVSVFLQHRWLAPLDVGLYTMTGVVAGAIGYGLFVANGPKTRR